MKPLFSKPWSILRLSNLTIWLAVFTILANLAEGAVSTWIGASDESLALFGFGVDSFIEVFSAAGILIMLVRVRRNPDSPRSHFESLALKMTGTGLYLLAVGLVVTAVLSLITQRRPETTLGGTIISLISLAVMVFLYRAKLFAGRSLNSPAVIADASCTKTCIYMSAVLLASSLAFTWFNFGLLDALGALGIAWFAFIEGREAFEKAAEPDED